MAAFNYDQVFAMLHRPRISCRYRRLLEFTVRLRRSIFRVSVRSAFSRVSPVPSLSSFLRFFFSLLLLLSLLSHGSSRRVIRRLDTFRRRSRFAAIPSALPFSSAPHPCRAREQNSTILKIENSRNTRVTFLLRYNTREITARRDLRVL